MERARILSHQVIFTGFEKRPVARRRRRIMNVERLFRDISRIKLITSACHQIYENTKIYSAKFDDKEA